MPSHQTAQNKGKRNISRKTILCNVIISNLKKIDQINTPLQHVTATSKRLSETTETRKQIKQIASWGFGAMHLTTVFGLMCMVPMRPAELMAQCTTWPKAVHCAMPMLPHCVLLHGSGRTILKHCWWTWSEGEREGAWHTEPSPRVTER